MNADEQPTRPGSFADGAVPVVIVSMLILLPAISCLARGSMSDPDVWWHLKAGQWIIEEGSFPTVDSFSSHGGGNSWAAYSWVAEVTLAGLHAAFGLRGIVLFSALLAAAIVAAFYNLVRRIQPNPLIAYTLTLTAVIGLMPLLSPRPWLLTILLFVLELDLILTAGRTGNRRLLLWLVPLFCVWANVHIQFTMGLVILGLAVAESVAVRIFSIQMADDDSRRIEPGWMFLVFALCMAATLVNPYGWRLYAVALELLGGSKLWNVISELKAMGFRDWASWIVLAVAVSAAFAMGWRRRIRLFLPMLFVMSVYFGFRSHREMWFVLLVGLTSLGYVCPQDVPARTVAAARSKWATLGLVTLLITATFLSVQEPALAGRLAANFPVEAVRFVHEKSAEETEFCSGPLFNSFAWGGYLIYHLPELPVSIDGRTMVHGQDRLIRHADTLHGRAGWSEDPELCEARLVILPREQMLTTLLRYDPRFHVAYEDQVATVFLKGKPAK